MKIFITEQTNTHNQNPTPQVWRPWNPRPGSPTPGPSHMAQPPIANTQRGRSPQPGPSKYVHPSPANLEKVNEHGECNCLKPVCVVL